jgi:hypothetical protein
MWIDAEPETGDIVRLRRGTERERARTFRVMDVRTGEDNRAQACLCCEGDRKFWIVVCNLQGDSFTRAVRAANESDLG